jgi:hypothetical protein
MSHRDQITRDLERVDRWCGMEIVDRAVYSSEHHDEFCFFWNRVSQWAERFGAGVPVERVLHNGELCQRLAAIISYARGNGNGELQGLHNGRRRDQSSLALSGAAMPHASSTGHQEPSRTHA